MKLTLLCNAGIALETDSAMLLVDLPNQNVPPFYPLPDETWESILNRQPPYDKVCGIWITHNHPDHCDLEKLHCYKRRWPEVPVFIPETTHVRGRGAVGPYQMQYQRMRHAPIVNPPPHVVTWIEVEGKSVYLAADAVLDPLEHRSFIRGRKADVAIWNSMFLSRPETRTLMGETARRNLIYHMPAERSDHAGLWAKLEKNFERYGPELETVTVMERYPTTIEI